MGRYFHPKLTHTIEALRCELCQLHKTGERGYGKLPPRDVRAAPWEQVDVDLIGPWKIQVKTGKTLEFIIIQLKLYTQLRSIVYMAACGHGHTLCMW